MVVLVLFTRLVCRPIRKLFLAHVLVYLKAKTAAKFSGIINAELDTLHKERKVSGSGENMRMATLEKVHCIQLDLSEESVSECTVVI